MSGDVLINTLIEHVDGLDLGDSWVKVASQNHANHVFSTTRASKCDLRILRDFLESAGCSGILPPDEHCIPLIHILRSNLPKVEQKVFPTRLEVLFPVMYPGHHLIGLNHDAVIDCRQTRLVCIGFNELCRPVAERGQQWRGESLAGSSQTSILDWLKKDDTAPGPCDNAQRIR
ncbi:hypothetical protein V8C34DRAFT_317822 [Trichoderma compactum]